MMQEGEFHHESWEQIWYPPIIIFPWNLQGGRLQFIKAGTQTNPTSLHYFEYDYDPVGNIDWIKDYKSGLPQIQTFEFDNLNRLINASASGGINGLGDYPAKSYEYNSPIGNMTKKAGLNYSYENHEDETVPHAVKLVIGNSPSNKTITIRARGTVAAQVYPIMVLYVNDLWIESWSVNSGSYTNYSTAVQLTGKDKIEVVFTNDYSAGGEDRNLYIDYVIVDGITVQAEEEHNALIDKGAGSQAFDGVNMVVGQEALYWNAALQFVVGEGAFAGLYDGNGNLTSRSVDGAGYLLNYNSENRLTSVSGAAFTSFEYDGDGNRVITAEEDGTTVYIGNYLEVFEPANPQPTPDPLPTPAALTYSGKAENVSGDGIANVTISLQKEDVCTGVNGYLNGRGNSTYTQVSGTLKVYTYQGTFVQTYSGTLLRNVLYFNSLSLPAGSYQGYVTALTWTGKKYVTRYSTVQSFAVKFRRNVFSYLGRGVAYRTVCRIRTAPTL